MGGEKLPASSPQQHSQDRAKSPRFNAGNVRLENQHRSYKGKEPISPQVAHKQNRCDPLRASALCIRDPTVEAGDVPLTKKGLSNLELIKPKDEPFTEDMYTNNTPQYEAPIAVIRPGTIGSYIFSVN